MGKLKVTDEDKDIMRILFTKGLLPCEEIGERLGLSRQTVAVTLKKIGVDTSKHKHVVPCSECGTPTEKTRAEIRKHKEHFCSVVCYSAWMKRPEVHEENQRQHVAREQIQVKDPWVQPGIYLPSDGDIWVFESRDRLLEWERTGLPANFFSVKKYKEMSAVYKDGI